EESATPQNRRDVAIALNRVGDVWRDRNQPDRASEFFMRSLELSEQLLEESATPQNRRELAVTLNRVGDVWRDRNQPDKSLEFFMRSLELSEQLLEESATPQNRRDVAYALIRVGDVWRDRNQPDKALEFFMRDLELSEQLLEESATPQNRRGVAVTLNRVGNVWRDRNLPDKALEFFMRSLELSEQLLGESRTPQTLNDVFITMSKVAAVQRSQGKDEIATARNPWKPELWQQFRENIWSALNDQQQSDLLAHFPQAEETRAALAGDQIAARPTLGFTIAACQHTDQPARLYNFIDFQWWSKESSPEDQAGEHLEKLTRDQHEWGILRTADIPETLELPDHPDITQEETRTLEYGLAMSISVEEKHRVVTSYPKLSRAQVEEMLRILTQEQVNFALMEPQYQVLLATKVQKIWKEQNQ
ncbi:tetratricopeptide repeat protein, partial [Desulfococcaceae bacterium HSG8]|nr:tetratricopeptide repeat protein [Desulfococcaceae bacterium HSG8]